MPLDCEVNIEKNAPVRLLNAVMERMDYSKLCAAYSRLGRIEYSPKILLKIMVYGYMRKQISSRALEACCRENLHFIYLLEGQRAPDHNTINRFRKNILTQEAGQDILHQLVVLLHEKGLAYVKQDLDFRRFLLRGNVKVAAEWLLFSLALNILRLHHKIQNGRLGSGLIVPSSFPAGL